MRRPLLRLARAGGTVLGAAVLVWLLTSVLPGDAATTILGPQATPERVAELHHRLGLDRPHLVQLADWVGGLARGDLGVSLVSGEPVGPLLVDRAANSLALLAATAAVVLVWGMSLGVAAGLRAHRAGGALLSGVSVAVVAVPEFVVAALLVTWLAVGQRWLPAVSVVPSGESAWGNPLLLVVPALALGIGVGSWVARYVRAVVAEHTSAPHVVAARVAGLPEHQVLRRHLLPAALAPIVQQLGWALALLLGGAVVVEQVVQFPGLGSLLVEATGDRDLPVVTAIAVVMAAAVSLGLLLSDLLAARLDRRVREPAR